jgi:hypothetical protein
VEEATVTVFVTGPVAEVRAEMNTLEVPPDPSEPNAHEIVPPDRLHLVAGSREVMVSPGGSGSRSVTSRATFGPAFVILAT